MLSDIIKKYNPPKELIGSVKGYYFKPLTSTNSGEYDTLESAVEVMIGEDYMVRHEQLTTRLILELVDDSTGVDLPLELWVNIDQTYNKSVSVVSNWSIYAPTQTRSVFENLLKVNIFSGKLDLNGYIEYYRNNKFKKFINKI